MIKDKKKLLEQITEFNKLQTHLAADCAAFCKDRANSIEDRWELFCEAPNKNHKSSQELPFLGKDFEISPYDDFNLERNAVFDVCDRINGWQEEFDGGKPDGFVEKLNQRKIDFFKVHYMDRYMGSWENDW